MMTTYPNNFITQVIARVDFQPILKLKNETPDDFQEAIRGQFPRVERKEAIDIDFSIKPGMDLPSFPEKISTWQFINKELTDQISLNYKVITFSSNKYINFESFFPKVELMYNSFSKIYQPGIINRIGLRFTNEIKLKGNPLDWNGYINNDLYCFTNAFPSLSLSRAMSQLHINLDDHKIIFQFGIYNSEYPNTISQKEFILDYDCSSKEECEPDVVLTKLKVFYEDIKMLFKRSRGEKLLQIMKGEAV
jgi:uncharacterized protein (TIGR04255 family)